MPELPDVEVYASYSSLSAHISDARIGATEDDDVHEPPFPDTEEVTETTYGPLKVACELLAGQDLQQRQADIARGRYDERRQDADRGEQLEGQEE